jgi:hypothetical protein
MRHKPVNTKTDFAKRYIANEFGNRAPTWDNPGEYVLSKYDGLVHIRNRIRNAQTWYDVSSEKFFGVWEEATSKYNVSDLYISAMCPTEKTICQGEIMHVEEGMLYLSYNLIAKPMRDAFKEQSLHAYGIVAVTLLKHFMDANSYEWTQTLLDRYPSHVIEFSTFSTQWGTLPNFNTVFWEVRNY